MSPILLLFCVDRIASDSLVLRTQSMYQFLCADANMPPPYLEVHWRHSSTGSFDEMEMEDMFDRTNLNFESFIAFNFWDSRF